MCFLRDVAFEKPTFMEADWPTLPEFFSVCHAVLLVLFSSVGRNGVSVRSDGPVFVAVPFNSNDSNIVLMSACVFMARGLSPSLHLTKILLVLCQST